MWISKKKWNCMEKRIADLEKKVQAQPNEIVNRFATLYCEQMEKRNTQMSKCSIRPQNPWE